MTPRKKKAKAKPKSKKSRPKPKAKAKAKSRPAKKKLPALRQVPPLEPQAEPIAAQAQQPYTADEDLEPTLDGLKPLQLAKPVAEADGEAPSEKGSESPAYASDAPPSEEAEPTAETRLSPAGTPAAGFDDLPPTTVPGEAPLDPPFSDA